MVSGRRGFSTFGLRLDRLGFNLRAFATYIGVSEVTVRRWSFSPDAASYVPMPPPIQRLLDLLEELSVPRPSQDRMGYQFRLRAMSRFGSSEPAARAGRKQKRLRPLEWRSTRPSNRHPTSELASPEKSINLSGTWRFSSVPGRLSTWPPSVTTASCASIWN